MQITDCQEALNTLQARYAPMTLWQEFKRDMLRLFGFAVRLWGSTLTVFVFCLAAQKYLPPWPRDIVQSIALAVWFGYMCWLMWAFGLRESLKGIRDEWRRRW